ncbi:MAG: MarC family protein [Planctomycetota bacterium]
MEPFLNTYVKMFFLLAPFFGTSIFLKMSEAMTPQARRRAAIGASCSTLAAITICFFFGKLLFNMLGITLAAFQIGAGTTLFLTSVMLVLGISRQPVSSQGDDFAVVPLSLPIIVGPGTIGTLMVWGTEVSGFREQMTMFAAILCGGLTMAVFLLLAEQIKKLLGQKTMTVLTKLTALILTALAAQIVFTGIHNFK